MFLNTPTALPRDFGSGASLFNGALLLELAVSVGSGVPQVFDPRQLFVCCGLSVFFVYSTATACSLRDPGGENGREPQHCIGLSVVCQSPLSFCASQHLAGVRTNVFFSALSAGFFVLCIQYSVFNVFNLF